MSPNPPHGGRGTSPRPRAEDVVAFVDAVADRACARCALALVGHDAVLSLLLGFREAPRCARCLAQAHGGEPDDFLRRAARNVRLLDCYRAGWAHADRLLAAAGPWPEERIPAALRMDALEPSAPDADLEGGTEDFAAALHRYDAGDVGCGELVLALRRRLAALAPNDLLHLTATDLGAPEDLPAWCRLTGHRLVRAEHPEYLIARREQP